MSRVRLDVQDGDWEKKLQEEKRRWGRLQAEMWVWPLCRSEARKEGQAGVGSGLGTVLGEFLCRLVGNTGAKVTIGGIPHLAGMGLPSFPSSLAGASMGHRVGSAQQGAVNQSVMGPAVGDPRG